jgi:hypothetical protein
MTVEERELSFWKSHVPTAPTERSKGSREMTVEQMRDLSNDELDKLIAQQRREYFRYK